LGSDWGKSDLCRHRSWSARLGSMGCLECSNDNKEVCEHYSETSKILSDPNNAQAHADQAGNEAGDIAQEAINFAAEAGSFSAGEAVGGGQPGM